jgi:hypothetical protein
MRGNGGVTPPFFTSALDGGEWSAAHPFRFIFGKRGPVPIVWEAEWAPELVWTLWNREKSLASTGTRTPAFQPVTHQCTDWLEY